jgi:hypothetical protein
LLIELERERVDLPLELAQAPGQPVSLFAERLGERHYRLDEPVLAVLGGGDVVHRRPPAKLATGQQIGCRSAHRQERAVAAPGVSQA